jgi:hypothetical protein
MEGLVGKLHLGEAPKHVIHSAKAKKSQRRYLSHCQLLQDEVVGYGSALIFLTGAEFPFSRIAYGSIP